tara:strand:+ start:57088 stop:57426 length:339 start_codon:yes stop_codon:yes gene_type:complete
MTTEKTNRQKEKELQGYDSDLTEDEKEMLHDENIHKSGGDDMQLRNMDKLDEEGVDFEGKDLDVPGRSNANKNADDNLLTDEENDLYSQGGNHTDLEKDQSTLEDKQNTSKK